MIYSIISFKHSIVSVSLIIVFLKINFEKTELRNKAYKSVTNSLYTEICFELYESEFYFDLKNFNIFKYLMVV